MAIKKIIKKYKIIVDIMKKGDILRLTKGRFYQTKRLTFY